MTAALAASPQLHENIYAQFALNEVRRILVMIFGSFPPFFFVFVIILYDPFHVYVRVWASDQRWHCVFQRYWHCVLLGMCTSALLPTPVFLIIVAISRPRSTLTYFLTSLSTDSVPRGNLRAGAGDFRKPSKGPEAVLGVDGKMHSARIYESSLNKKLSQRQRCSARARSDRRKSLRRSANLGSWRVVISAILNHRHFPMTALSVFILYWILKLPV